MTLAVVPVNIGAARGWVELHHSHHHAPLGALCAVGVALDGVLVPPSAETAAVVRAAVGKVELLQRRENLPLFAARA